MKERPILFNAEMVRAILEGKKTQTRRVIKPQPIVAFYQGKYPQFQCTGFKFYSPGYSPRELTQFCPYGQPGDRLWVRETWYSREDTKTLLGYKADGDIPHGKSYMVRPSIFLPRWASRITLEITEIRVQRLQDISAADTVAEGVTGMSYQLLWDYINGKKYPWESNPWVWCISFKRV